MTNVAAPVPVANITVPRGASRTIRLTITKDGVNPDLTIPGTAVIFTAKLKESDAVPAIQKAYAALTTVLPAGVVAGGIAVSHIDTNADSVLDTWVADVTINPADTEAIAASYLAWDAWLIDSSQESPVVEGRLRIAPTAFRP